MLCRELIRHARARLGGSDSQPAAVVTTALLRSLLPEWLSSTAGVEAAGGMERSTRDGDVSVVLLWTQELVPALLTRFHRALSSDDADAGAALACNTVGCPASTVVHNVVTWMEAALHVLPTLLRRMVVQRLGIHSTWSCPASPEHVRCCCCCCCCCCVLAVRRLPECVF